jgi:beta-1,4-mannosyl-glycoprotein beta-1,4-N-acetylglucosaminyltransferase
MTKIFDCFLYNGENDLLDIRLNYLYNYVDYFVVVESCQTFQAKKKKIFT